MKKRAVLIMILVLIIISSTAVGFFYLRGTPNETDDEAETETPRKTAEATGETAADFTELPETSEEVPKIAGVIDFEEWQSRNEDIYSWIYIPDTRVNHPIVQSKTDDKYYLNHDIDGNATIAASIFTERRNTTSFSDYNTLIYGHNMKNGTMFADILKYRDSEFFENHREVYIYTPERAYKYRIFAAYVNDNNHVLYANDFSTEQGFQTYLDMIRSKTDGIFDKSFEIKTSNRIITLSTCTASRSERFLIQAVLAAIYEYEDVVYE